MTLPSITIITPCLNRAATLPAALASVRDQGYPNLEHIVVDGASTDGSVDVLRATPDLRWISEPDRGLAHAINKGVALARGEVIGWLNADDEYEPGALEAAGKAFADHPTAEWVTGRCRIVDGPGNEIRRWVTAYKNLLLDHYSRRLYLTHNFVSCPATFVRKVALDEIGPLDERFAISMDYDLFLRLAKRTDPVIVNRTLARFRMTEGTLSMSGFGRQFKEHAVNARDHGQGHPGAVLINQLLSRMIVIAYRGMRLGRRFAARCHRDRPRSAPAR